MKYMKKLFVFLMVCLVTIVGIPSITTQAATTQAADADTTNDHIYFIELTNTNANKTKGNATLIESKGEFGLIDAGKKKDTSTKGNVNVFVGNKLKLNEKKLKFLIVSHLDADHANGIPNIINNYCDDKTILCIKEFNGPSSDDHYTTYNNIIKAAKAQSLIIYKIKPTTTVSKSTSLSKITNKMMTTYFTCWEKQDSGKYVKTGKIDKEDSLKIGNFTLTLYNGNNWNSTDVIKKLSSGWDENVNSVTTLIQRTGSKLTTYSTYLGSDLGENSTYSLTIAKKAIKAMNKKVTVYQVAHHGFYNSLTKAMAKSLDFKYAIVTNNFDAVLNTGIKKYKKNYKDPTKTLKSLDTLTALMGSSKISKNTVYFTSGGTVKSDTKTILSKSKKNVTKYFNTKSNGKTIVSGTVDVCLENSSITISQK